MPKRSTPAPMVVQLGALIMRTNITEQTIASMSDVPVQVVIEALETGRAPPLKEDAAALRKFVLANATAESKGDVMPAEEGDKVALVVSADLG